MPLTEAACRNAKKRAKDYKISDSGQLYLLVRPNGSKLWRLKYKFEGREKTLSIGPYPAVTLAEARRARDKAKELLAAGRNPNDKGKAADTPPDRRFEAVAREWFAAKVDGWVPTYSSVIMGRLEGDVFPAFGDRDIGEIEPGDVLTMLRKIEARGSLETARRMRQYVSAIFCFAVASGLAKADPAASVRAAMKTPAPQRHHSSLRAADLPEFFARLRAYDGDRVTALAIEVVVHTFVRTQEIRLAEWGEFEGDIWRIPAEHMKMGKEHMVPLTSHVRGLLDRLREAGDGSKWVVPGERSGEPVSNNTMLFALYRMGYHSRATIHGFRSTASTTLNESNLWRPDAIERQLAHVPKDEVRSAYNAALYLEERTRMMNWYSDFLLAKAAEPRRPELDLSDLLD